MNPPMPLRGHTEGSLWPLKDARSSLKALNDRIVSSSSSIIGYDYIGSNQLVIDMRRAHSDLCKDARSLPETST